MNIAGERRWRKSSFCSNEANCVELTSLQPGSLGVRDNMNIDGPILEFSVTEFSTFVSQIKEGRLNLHP